MYGVLPSHSMTGMASQQVSSSRAPITPSTTSCAIGEGWRSPVAGSSTPSTVIRFSRIKLMYTLSRCRIGPRVKLTAG